MSSIMRFRSGVIWSLLKSGLVAGAIRDPFQDDPFALVSREDGYRGAV